MMKTYVVLVPRPGTRAASVIDSGSGVVAATPHGGLTRPADYYEKLRQSDVLAYYEGNRYGVANMQKFEERVLHAAGRLDKHYPTIARGSFSMADFDVVGTFTHSEDWRWHELDVTNPAK